MKGILFKEPMNDATVEYRKCETRRLGSLGKLPENTLIRFNYYHYKSKGYRLYPSTKDGGVMDNKGKLYKPRFKVGELAYIKEPIAIDGDSREIIYVNNQPIYRYKNPNPPTDVKWQNKLFLPERLARHKIEITDVYAQRLMDIDEAAARWEGFDNRDAFLEYFKKINPKCDMKTAWNWVYEYRLCDDRFWELEIHEANQFVEQNSLTKPILLKSLNSFNLNYVDKGGRRNIRRLLNENVGIVVDATKRVEKQMEFLEKRYTMLHRRLTTRISETKAQYEWIK